MTIESDDMELIEKRIMDKSYDNFIKKEYCLEHHKSNKEGVDSVKRMFTWVIGLLALFILSMGFSLIEANMQKTILQENFQKINQVMGIK